MTLAKRQCQECLRKFSASVFCENPHFMSGENAISFLFFLMWKSAQSLDLDLHGQKDNFTLLFEKEIKCELAVCQLVLYLSNCEVSVAQMNILNMFDH